MNENQNNGRKGRHLNHSERTKLKDWILEHEETLKEMCKSMPELAREASDFMERRISSGHLTTILNCPAHGITWTTPLREKRRLAAHRRALPEKAEESEMTRLWIAIDAICSHLGFTTDGLDYERQFGRLKGVDTSKELYPRKEHT